MKAETTEKTPQYDHTSAKLYALKIKGPTITRGLRVPNKLIVKGEIPYNNDPKITITSHGALITVKILLKMLDSIKPRTAIDAEIRQNMITILNKYTYGLLTKSSVLNPGAK